MTRCAVSLAVLAGLLAFAPARAVAQSDPRVLGALRLAQDGRIDSARVSLSALEKSLVPTDTAYAQLLFAQGLVAPTVDEARQRLQRVVTEYPLSAWSDDAVVRLAQLEYANGDAAAAMRQLEKFHGDYAASPLFPVAAMWASRALLRAKDTLGGCRWVSEGLGRVGQDAATRRELAALQAKCGGRMPAQAQPPVVASADTPSVVKPVDVSVSTPAPAAPAPAATQPAVSAAQPLAAGTWRVQIIAAGTAAEADQQLQRAKRAGFEGLVVREGPYHKVRLGSYTTRTAATTAAAKVKAQLGGQPYVVQDK